MAKKAFNSRHNFNKNDYPGEYNDQPSMTQPDHALSVRELINRHARGIEPVAENIYDFNEAAQEFHQELLPDLSRMDKAERAAVIKEIQQVQADLWADIKEQEKEWDKAQKMAEEEAKKQAKKDGAVEDIKEETEE